MTPPLQRSAGTDPQYGAYLNYWLPEATESDVTLHVTNAAGDTVRTLDGSKDAGINRVVWDLQGEPSTEIILRTKPLYADWFNLNDERQRPSPQPSIGTTPTRSPTRNPEDSVVGPISKIRPQHS